jgi:hypothetical protein
MKLVATAIERWRHAMATVRGHSVMRPSVFVVLGRLARGPPRYQLPLPNRSLISI